MQDSTGKFGFSKRRLLSLAAKSASAVGLGALAYRLLGLARKVADPDLRSENRRMRKGGAPDGNPIPPDHLIHLVAGSPSIRSFLDGGHRAADSIRNALADAGHKFEDFDEVLDFGCGCGRVLRQWTDLQSTRLHGCDYNPQLTSWVAKNLPTAEVYTNDLLPPLPVVDQSFDFVYALSVFTHLTESVQQEWLAEFHRVLRPQGLLLLTLHGEKFTNLLEEADRKRFAEGQLVVTHREYEGSNVCAASTRSATSNADSPSVSNW